MRTASTPVPDGERGYVAIRTGAYDDAVAQRWSESELVAVVIDIWANPKAHNSIRDKAKRPDPDRVDDMEVRVARWAGVDLSVTAAKNNPTR